MATINASVFDPPDEWVRSRVKSGRYADASEYAGEPVRPDHIESVEDKRWLAELEQKIAAGLADIEAGRVYNPDEIFDEIETPVAEIGRRQKVPWKSLFRTLPGRIFWR